MSGSRLRCCLTALSMALVSGCSPSLGRTSTAPYTQASLWGDSSGPTIMYPSRWHLYHLDSAGSSFAFFPGFLSDRVLSLATPPGCMPDEPVRQCAPAIPAGLTNPSTGLADCAPRQTVTVCAPRITQLAPGEVYIGWVQVDAFPFAGQRQPFGTSLRVDGHEARLLAGRAGLSTCPPKTDERIMGRVYYDPHKSVRLPAHSSWYEMDACLRGPHLARLQAQVLSIFTSLRRLP